MKIQKNKKSPKNKIFFITLAVAILAAGSIGAYALLKPFDRTPSQSSSNNSTDDTKKPSKKEQAETDAQQKQEFLDNEKEESKNPTSQTSPSELELTTQIDGNNLVISSKITNASSGKCNITVTNGKTTVHDSADIIYTPSYSTCAGFSIDKNQFESGTVTITVTAITSESTITQTITHDL